MSLMKTVGYIRVSTDKQADRGVSLDAQAEKIRAMAVVHSGELIDLIVAGGESAKSLNRPGMVRLLALVDSGAVKAVIVAKLDRLTRSVKDLCPLLERFERRGVALVSVAESLDTGSAAGRLVLNIMTAVSQWGREAIGERTRDALSHKRGMASGLAIWSTVIGSRTTGNTWIWVLVSNRRWPRDPAFARRRHGLARDRRGPEPSSVPNAAGHGLAAGVCGTSRETGPACAGYALANLASELL
jgi:site-specific DNA recombinase